MADRERSPDRGDRRRSRSPRYDRRDDRSRKSTGGFKWKEKQRRKDDENDEGRNGTLQRGYRDYYKPRARSRSRTRSPRPRAPRRDDTTTTREPAEVKEKKEQRDTTEKKDRRPAPAAPQQPMIIVYVNDRLGTKKAIPCFPTDPIKDFKVIVASMIGRQPHEILLKRQGERPFKDQLTLQDYGVSNGVQIDLEVDTGD